MTLEFEFYRRLDLIVPAAPATGTQIFFQIDEELDNHIVYGIETYNDVQLSRGNTGPCVTAAKGAEVTLYLAMGATEKIYGIPYQSLNPALNSGFVKQFKNIRINLTKSYAMLVSAAAILAADNICCGFVYKRKN